MNGPMVTDWDDLRAEFVRIIAKECPEVIEDLATANSVKKWAEKYRLDVFPWILEHARNTRNLWKMAPKVDRLEIWRCVNVGSSYRVATPVFSVQWDPRTPPVFIQVLPEVEGEKKFLVGGSKEEARKLISTAVRAYLNRVEAAEKDAGFKPYNLRNRDGRTPSDRLKWVVMHLCLGMTFDEILNNIDNPPDENSSIRKAVGNTIKELNLNE